MRDKLFAKKTDLIDFAFDEKVANVFDDMVQRSIPGYQALIEIIGLFVKIYGQDKTNYYDLGASTGAVALALGLHNPHQNNRIIAVDNAPAMIKKCEKNLLGKIKNFEVICSDISDICIENASIVVLNFTLQFLPPELRQALINKIYQGLNATGALIISEKIHFNSSEKQAQMAQLHLDFKRANGYSELEIANKRQTLENVLITDNSETHLTRLNNAGFKKSICHFQCLNFASFLAVK